ncbi:hypothetical protein MA16_Dca028262 [Dendrobium catenatum]|uniref:Putative E3 ubiquitin-protein ligase LIN N-terminal domain-containing protein n=1 Tax=Dendrobium catenatum TaxID=906689 RepID=A0A2I0V6V8_9ASPA|nr:hypothetical protein MA16_Dca028262 [Dendrobium catenatum]
MQIFSHSPYLAQIVLLPGLWEGLFLPHLSHLKAWHGREAESLEGASGVKWKLEFLKELYVDLLNMGTSKFATFYKGWLMEDFRSTALPSSLPPFASFPEISEDACEIVSAKSSSSSYSVPSKAIISKLTYESVLNETKEDSKWIGKLGGRETEMEDVIEESPSMMFGDYRKKMQKGPDG